MQIRNFVRESNIDFPGKVPSAVVFTPGCNYRCPSCHAKHLLQEGRNMKEEEFFDYLDARKGWLEGVVICGGEPTLQATLKYFAWELKERGLAVKLDTNGSNPEDLRELKEKGLVDYVAMDVKAPSYLYKKVVGRDLDLRDDVEKGIAVVSQFPDYEFRTTITPIKRKGGKINFMTIREVCDIAKWIVGLTGDDTHKYFLQPFVPRKDGLIDSDFEKIGETPKELLEYMKKEVSKYLPKCDIR